MSDYLVSYNLPDYSDEYSQNRSTNDTALGLDLLMYIMVLSHILRTQTLRFVILQLILLGNTLVQILSDPLKNQNGAGTMQSKYHNEGDNFMAKITAAFVILVSLFVQLECVSADSQCQPQPPDCYPCDDTWYYLDERLNSCQVCLRCLPGLQPDKPCGPDARCIRCKPGLEFSDQNDQDICHPCKKCENTINDVQCTTTSDRQCGLCAPGFGYYDSSQIDHCHPCEWIGAKQARKQDSCKIPTKTQALTTTLTTTRANPTIKTTAQQVYTSTDTPTEANPSTVIPTEANPSTALTEANSIPVTNTPSVTTTRAKPVSKEAVSYGSDYHETGDNAEKHYPNGKFHIGAKLSGSGKMVLIAFAIGAFVILLVVFCLYKIWSKYLNYQPVTNSDKIQDERSSGSQADDIENQKSSSTMAADGNPQISSIVYHNSIYRDQDVPQNSTQLDFNTLGPHYKPKSSAFKSTKEKCMRKETARKLSKSESSSALLDNDSNSQEHDKKETATLVKSPSPLSINGGRLERRSSPSLDGIAFDTNRANSEENKEEKQGEHRSLNSQDAHPAQNLRKDHQDFHNGEHQICDSSAPINDLVRPAQNLRKDSQDFPDGKHQTRDSSINDFTLPIADNGSRYPIQASQSDGVTNQKPACFMQQTAKVVTTLSHPLPQQHSTCVSGNSMDALVDTPESAKAPTNPSGTRHASMRPLLTRQTTHSSDPRSFSSPPIFGNHNPFWQTSVPSTSSLFENTGLSVKPSVFNNTRRQSIQSTPLPRNEERNESNLRDAILTPQLLTPTPQPSAPTPQPSAAPTPQPLAPTPQPSASTPQPSAPTPQPSASMPQRSAQMPQPSTPTPQPSTSTQRDGTFFTNCTFNGPFVLASNSQHSSYTIAESIIDKRNYSNSNPNDAAT